MNAAEGNVRAPLPHAGEVGTRSVPGEGVRAETPSPGIPRPRAGVADLSRKRERCTVADRPIALHPPIRVHPCASVVPLYVLTPALTPPEGYSN